MIYFAPPQTELFCKWVSRMYNNTKDVTTEMTPFSPFAPFSLNWKENEKARKNENRSLCRASEYVLQPRPGPERFRFTECA